MKATRPFFVLMLLLMSMAAAAAANESAEDLVLIEVNGEPITGADLDRMIMETHRDGGMSAAQAEGLVPRLLEKAVRDRLILQDAYAMGMYDELSVRGPVDELVMRRAISLYSRSMVELPEVTEEDKQQFFRDYYHKIQVRQLSLPTADDCLAARARIESGEITMGTLAVESSMDTAKARGGLHNDKYWADVENLIRDAVRDLEVGEYSDPFPRNDVWSIVRVESRTPPDPDDFERFEQFIFGVLRNERYEAVWAELVADHESRVQIELNQDLLDRMLADEEILYRGEFTYGNAEPVLSIDPSHVITDEQFRKAMSHTAMEMGSSTIQEILDATLSQQREQLVLGYFAEKEGWLEKPEVLEYRQMEMDRVVLNNYLQDNIHQKISVERSEYEAFYEEHAAEFRGPEEVRLSVLTTSDVAVIEEAIQRLEEGADFDFLRAEIEGRDVDALTQSESWSPTTVFSKSILDAISELEVGETSAPIPFARSWMIIRLDGRREGSIPPIEEVESRIRQALYIREFTRVLDAHLARLEAASEITRYEDRIQTWAESES